MRKVIKSYTKQRENINKNKKYYLIPIYILIKNNIKKRINEMTSDDKKDEINIVIVIK